MMLLLYSGDQRYVCTMPIITKDKGLNIMDLLV